MSSFQFTI
ncbi:Protein of unknown function [Pyronema omphalodes CBS 100304]|uniref:Uncharacterized protein n=1 Tax=Pyronema omphalodes (strain CBS 100304) TaxID=1076935 RepID=U4LVW3_PYROM|nr:Protein of unknown function [Pyronema omphalodes CBS 100304]